MGDIYDDTELCGSSVVQYCRDSDDNLWKKFRQDEERIAKLVAQGKYWVHTCSECGKTFQNDEPEKGYLCDECGRKALQRLRDEWE